MARNKSHTKAIKALDEAYKSKNKQLTDRLEELLLPKDILIPHEVEDQDLIVEWLSEKKGSRVRIEVPVRGKKRELVKMAEENSRFAMRTEMDKGEVATRMLEELQEKLDFWKIVRTRELCPQFHQPQSKYLASEECQMLEIC